MLVDTCVTVDLSWSPRRRQAEWGTDHCLTLIHSFTKLTILVSKDWHTTLLVRVFVCVCVSLWVVGPHSCERECYLSHMFDKQIEPQQNSGNVPCRFFHSQIWRHWHSTAHKNTRHVSRCWLCVWATAWCLCVQCKSSDNQRAEIHTYTHIHTQT